MLASFCARDISGNAVSCGLTVATSASGVGSTTLGPWPNFGCCSSAPGECCGGDPAPCAGNDSETQHGCRELDTGRAEGPSLPSRILSSLLFEIPFCKNCSHLPAFNLRGFQFWCFLLMLFQPD